MTAEQLITHIPLNNKKDQFLVFTVTLQEIVTSFFFSCLTLTTSLFTFIATDLFAAMNVGSFSFDTVFHIDLSLVMHCSIKLSYLLMPIS